MKEQIINILNKSPDDQRSFTMGNLMEKFNNVEAEELNKIINQLLDEGILRYNKKKDKYIVTFALKGRINLTSSGNGFVKVEGLDDDIFVNAADTCNCLEADTVLVEPFDRYYKDSKGIIHPSTSGKIVGKIIKVLSHSSQKMIGEVYTSLSNCYVRVFDRKTKDVLIAKDKTKGATDGDRVVIKYITVNNETVGEITEVVQAKNELDKILVSHLLKYEFNTSFPKSVMDEATSLPNCLNEKDIAGRLDLRDKVIFTIDGKDTKDIDDAISIEKLPNNHYLLGVHIADVTHYVKQGSPLDVEANIRGTSVYLLDTVTPQFPPKLSNGICSLNPNVDRLALSVFLEIDENGNVLNMTNDNPSRPFEVYESIIHSNIKMDYTSVNKIIEQGQEVEGYEDYIGDLKLMAEVCKLLRKKMLDNGFIEFADDECKIELDQYGDVVDITTRIRGFGEKMIETFMVAANVYVDTYATSNGFPLIHRVHDVPNQKRLEEFIAMLLNSGIDISFNPNQPVSSLTLQNISNQLVGLPGETVLSHLLIRCQAKAKYSTDNIGHFGLGQDNYCHFTSPIRRLADLLVHRTIKTMLSIKNNKIDDLSKEELEILKRNLEATALVASERERASESCERDVEDIMKARYMTQFINQEFDGYISDIAPFGMFVTLPNTVDGLISIKNLPGLSFDKKRKILTSKSNKIMYQTGQPIRIRVVGTNPDLGEVDFMAIDYKVEERKGENDGYKKKKQKR
ncbi:MAG: ribonuclease R [bacterium]|nr:ribonuclease R [bacterium]